MVIMGLFRALSEIKRDICEIFPPRIFNALADGKFVMAVWLKKARMMPILDRRKCDDESIRLDTVPT